MILWLSRRIHVVTGIPLWEILASIPRLANGQGLDGHPPGSLVEAYAGPCLELSHIAAPLHELDKDGTTARLWCGLYRRWPIFREIFRETFPSRAGATGDSATDPKASREMMLSPDRGTKALPAPASADQEQEEGRLAEPAKPMTSWMASAELACALGVPKAKNAVDVALRRFADKNSFCREEVPNSKKGEPRVVYRVNDVWPFLLSKLPRWRSSSPTTD